MSTQLFPNGTSLSSSALTPASIAGIFQILTAQILGFNVPANPPSSGQAAYNAVRVGWQQTGQPAWKINEDVAIITAYAEDDAYSQVRDQQYSTNTSSILNQVMGYTQVWRIHWTLYGPNAFDHARLIVSAMSLDWVHDYLQNPPPPVNTAIYAITKWDRPKVLYELFQGQWFQRADVDLKFNELVQESTTVNSALAATVVLDTENGQTETVVMES